MGKLCLEGILSVFNNNCPGSVHRRQEQQPVEAKKEDRSSNPQHELSVFMYPHVLHIRLIDLAAVG